MVQRHLTTGIGLIDGAIFLPLHREIQRSEGLFDVITGDALTIKRALEKQELVASLAAPSSLLTNAGFELTMAFGLSLTEGVGYSYLAFPEAVRHLKPIVEKQLERVRAALQNVAWSQTEDTASAVRNLWQRSSQAAGAAFQHACFLKYSSALTTGNLFAKVLYRLMFGETEHQANEMRNQLKLGASAIEVLDGDAAFRRRDEFAEIIALDTLWLELTGLPFVIAAWQRYHRPFPNSCRSKIMTACEMAETRMKNEPSYYLSHLPADEAAYYSAIWQRVTLRLGPSELKGLLLFLNLIHHLDHNADKKEQLTVKMIRWQQRQV